MNESMVYLTVRAAAPHCIPASLASTRQAIAASLHRLRQSEEALQRQLDDLRLYRTSATPRLASR